MLRLIQEALTFDDVLLIPGYSEVLPRDVTLTTRITRDVALNIPLISSAMDTVTESKLAIAMAQEGGLGVIHKNMSVEQQATEVRRVKKHESGVVKNPITIEADATLHALLALKKKYDISGVPVLHQGELVGIVTSRDVRFEKNLDQKVAEVMTPRSRLVSVPEGTHSDEIQFLLKKHRIEKILVLDKQDRLAGMITVKDIQKSTDFPHASKDDSGRLCVGAAVGTDNVSIDRIGAIVEAGVDVIVVDTAHGHSKSVIERIQWIKKTFPELQVIGGNIATADAADALIKAGVDGLKVGIGPGSICTTRIVTGVGIPQISAIVNVVEAAKKKDVPVIADGGIRYSGDIAKAIAAGASAIMIGSMFAGTEEAPGEIIFYQGRSYKMYRGMGSLGAMASHYGSKDRYFQSSEEQSKLVPEGIEGRVPYKGTLTAVIHQLLGGLRSAMGYTGAKNIDTMRTQPCFVRVSNASMSESHVHNVTITKEAPNYQVQ